MLSGEYRRLVGLRKLKLDPAQESALRKLSLLAKTLDHTPFITFFSRKHSPAKGLYMWGDVGRGKTLLMDMFYDGIKMTRKRRVHFNSFMVDVHARIHAQRQSLLEVDPISAVVKSLAQEAQLLCFDEFQVSDVADAMILGRLFEGLFDQGVTIVATSNTQPEKLYEGGLNRQLFLPFIAQILQWLEIVELNGPTDYRSQHISGLKIYNTPLGPEAELAMQKAWQKLTEVCAGTHPAGLPVELSVLGRTFKIGVAANQVARIDFKQLCVDALGAADYLALAQRFHTIVIDHIPQLTLQEGDQTKRFILLIDTLYDAGVKLICSAAVPAAQLLQYESSDSEAELVTAFRRTTSRLMEMRSDDYLNRVWAFGAGLRPENSGRWNGVLGSQCPILAKDDIG